MFARAASPRTAKRGWPGNPMFTRPGSLRGVPLLSTSGRKGRVGFVSQWLMVLGILGILGFVVGLVAAFVAGQRLYDRDGPRRRRYRS